MSNILDKKPKELLEKFIEDYNNIFDIDVEKTRRIMKGTDYFDSLTNKWYENLEKQDFDKEFSIYNEDYYFTDMWYCFQKYSRGYLKSLYKNSMSDGSAIYDFIKHDVNTILDLGCGIGYTTSALKQIFPNQTVYATNLKETKQWKFCQMMSQQYNFILTDDINEIPEKIDFVFASEYFEHIYDCIDHLLNIIEMVSPKYFFIANSFNTRSVGHFEHYKFTDTKKPPHIFLKHESEISRLFNNTLREYGYEKIKTKLWNNKPTLWRKNE